MDAGDRRRDGRARLPQRRRAAALLGPGAAPGVLDRAVGVAAPPSSSRSSSIVFADEPVPGYRARLPPGRRRVRGLRADRLAPAAGQLQRPADGRDGLRAARRAGVRAGRLADAPAVRRPARGRVGHPGDRAAAELPQRRAARGDRRTACWSARSSCSTVVEFVRHLFLEREGNFLLVHADAAIADAFARDLRAC